MAKGYDEGVKRTHRKAPGIRAGVFRFQTIVAGYEPGDLAGAYLGKERSMNSEKLRQYILGLQRCDPSGSIHHPMASLVTRFGFQENQIKQILDEMQAEGLITVGYDHGFAVVRVMVRGVELYSQLPKSSIGFSLR